MAYKKLLAIVLIITALIAAAIAAAIINMAGDSIRITGFSIADPVKECALAEVPYNAEKTYSAPLTYEIISAMKGISMRGPDFLAEGTIVLKNADHVEGTFIVEQAVEALDKSRESQKESALILPGESKAFKAKFDSKVGEDFNWTYAVVPGEKAIMRNITEYKTVEKCA